MFKKGKEEETKISWFAQNLEDIKKIAMSIIFIGGLGYATIDWLSTKFITKAEAANFATFQQVQELDTNLAQTQLIVLQNELANARRVGIKEEDKPYLRSLDKQIFLLKIKLHIINAKPEDYIVPNYLK